MSNFRYFWPSDNVGPNATVTTGGSEDADYQLENAVDLTYKNLANPSKLTGTSGDWILDFNSAQRIDAVVIWHNLASGIAYSVQMNASNSWGAPTVNESHTAQTKRADGYTVKAYHELTGVAGYSASGFRYLRINVSGTNDVPVGLKILVFSQVRTMVRNYRWGYEWREHQTAIDMTTDAFVPWAYDLRAAPRVFRTDVNPTDADAEAWREWFRACGGRAKVAVFVPDPATREAIVGRWASNAVGIVSPSLVVSPLSMVRVAPNYHQSSVVFEEITAGDPEWY